MNVGVVVGSAVVGLLVGLTGAGGGALMTPMLIFVFSVKPAVAISSDLVATLVMRPVGAAVHFRRRSVNYRLVAWMAAASAPSAIAGSYILHLLGHTRAATANIGKALGAALVLGGAATVTRTALDRRSGRERSERVADLDLRRWPTIAIGMVGGLVVGATSVGAGSLVIVLLMFAYPRVAARQLVGTDLTHAIPLTAAAALGAAVFGHVQVDLTYSVIAGGVPAVLAGSLLSFRVSDRWMRPVIFCVVLGSGLEYLGAANIVIGAAVAVATAIFSADALRIRLTARRRKSSEVPGGSLYPSGPAG